MEQPCYKCGEVVEQGIPFCPHCSAPLIRVVLPEPVPASAEAPVSAQGSPIVPTAIQWSQATRACALAALIAALAMVFSLVVPLIAVIGAGFLATAFHRRSLPTAALRTGTGARLGALCGFFCALITAVLATLRVAVLHEGGQIRETMLGLLQQNAARYSDPQSQAALEFLRSPGGIAAMIVFFAIVGFLMFVLLGTIGGALGAAVLGRRNGPKS
jgi:hypothetical protein